MKFIADLHIHSSYSRATSKQLVPEWIEYWAKIKGIHLLGTGDCIHPAWLSELEEKLTDAGNGFYKLKPGLSVTEGLPSILARQQVRFVLTTELSSIYKKNGKVRKVHTVCVFPDFESAYKMQKKLAKLGNISSDGRPILGLDAKYILEMVLEIGGGSFLFPAHIWTPWFSVLGSNSGFDSLEECFEELTEHIFCVETGLSSDPPMNRMCSFLDKFRLISNSDAHSPEKLGREANIFDTGFSYKDILYALKEDKGFLGTIEFFPEEGKYHLDGHRKCQICWNPDETARYGGKCPVCGRPVTKGVLYRVMERADRKRSELDYGQQVFHSITPLPSLVSEILGKKSTTGKAVRQKYHHIIGNMGSEFDILLFKPLDEIKRYGGELMSEGIRRLRSGDVHIEAGYDGEFGSVKVFNPHEIETRNNYFLFDESTGIAEKSGKGHASKKIRVVPEEPFDYKLNPGVNRVQSAETKADKQNTKNFIDEITRHPGGPMLIVAGPGSGKTTLLIERVRYLIETKKVPSERVLAVTFSRKAAKEIRERLSAVINKNRCEVTTFHALGLKLLTQHIEDVKRRKGFLVYDFEECLELVDELFPELDTKTREAFLKKVEGYKQGVFSSSDGSFQARFKLYQQTLRQKNCFDIHDLIYLTTQLLKNSPEIREKIEQRWPYVCVDEFQDINARQYELIRLIAGKEDADIFAIGDPNQAIYSFRGSDVRFIEQFKSDYPDLESFSLPFSYRCPEHIIRVAREMLDPGMIFTGRDKDAQVATHAAKTDKAEADWIAAMIESMIGGVRSFSIDSGMSRGYQANEVESFSDFAVLCRTGHMFEELTKAFNSHGIPYQLVGEEPFYRRKPYRAFIQHAKKIYQNKIPTEDTIGDILRAKKPLIDVFRELNRNFKLSDEEFSDFTRFVQPFSNDYEAFFQAISLRRGIDEYNRTQEAVSLMTMHASKGLEFTVVFIPACEQGIIPFEIFGKKAEREEEARLLYVAMTRTQRYLFLSHADKRYIKGRILKNERSPLIKRVSKELFQTFSRPEKYTPSDKQLYLF